MSKNKQTSSVNFNNTGDISGRAANASVAGDNNTVNQQFGMHSEPLSVGPNEGHNLLVDISKFLYEKLGNKYYPACRGVAGISLIGLIAGMYPGLSAFGNVGSNPSGVLANLSQFMWFWTLALVSIAVLGIAVEMMNIPRSSTCPKCKKLFALHETDRELLRKGRVKDQTVYNYKVTEVCNSCDYTGNYQITEHEDINE
ncbi:Uncharacterised protein [uncultured archaeon]|nr:Uncharacterised protein [uncultured archaeon]